MLNEKQLTMTRYVMPSLIGLIGTAILIWLGVWQLQRLEWKESVLSEIETQLAAPPIEMPALPDPSKHKFTAVTVSGTVHPDRVFVFSSLKDLGVRFRVLQPLELADGRRIILELGTINPTLADNVNFAGPVAVEGMLHWPDEVDGFTPDPDLQNGIWYARDLSEISAVLGTDPILVVASSMDPSDPLIVPLPLDPTIIPNDHLQYAVTWFGLAVVWVGMTMLWLRRIARARYLER